MTTTKRRRRFFQPAQILISKLRNTWCKFEQIQVTTERNTSAQFEKSRAMSCLSSFVKKKPTVAVIVLEGEIGRNKALSLKETKKMINKAFEKPNLVAVAMVINSGGGSPVQSQLIASYLLDRSFLCILTPRSHELTEVIIITN